MKSLLKIATLFFISANVALASENIHSTAKSKMESSKSVVVGTKANDPEKGKFKRNPSFPVKPDGNVNRSADKGQIFSSRTYNVKPDGSAKK